MIRTLVSVHIVLYIVFLTRRRTLVSVHITLYIVFLTRRRTLVSVHIVLYIVFLTRRRTLVSVHITLHIVFFDKETYIGISPYRILYRVFLTRRHILSISPYHTLCYIIYCEVRNVCVGIIQMKWRYLPKIRCLPKSLHLISVSFTLRSSEHTHYHSLTALSQNRIMISMYWENEMKWIGL